MSKPLVVITGASSGIGEATARLLSQEGYPLLLLARRIERMEKLALPNCLCRQVDVANRQEMLTAIAEAEQQFGPVDCLINNAGVMLLGAMEKQDPAEWDQMFNVNVIGLLNGIHAVVGNMSARQQGTIINVSSLAGRKTFPIATAYVGTKFAVHAISESLRESVANRNVRVITIAPGAVETELPNHTTDEQFKIGYWEWRQTMGQVLSAEDIANAIYYAYQQPQYVCIREIVLAGTTQQP